MVYTIAIVDDVLAVIFCWEVCAVLWLLPRGAAPQAIRQQRLNNLLLGLLALPLASLLFLPPTINPSLLYECLVLALMPLYVGLNAYVALLIVRTWRQRQLHRQRQGML